MSGGYIGGGIMFIKKPKSVIIVGCGRFGSSLAGDLSGRGYHTVIIDKDTDSFRKLPESYSGYNVTGDGRMCDTLENCGIKEADMLIAATDSDNTNSLIAQIASRIYNVGKVYMRLNDGEKKILTEGLNIDVILPHELCLQAFEEASSIGEKDVRK